MKPNHTLNNLGLAFRAKKLIHGEGLVLSALKKYPEGIVFLANDAGDNITAKIEQKCKTFQVSLNKDYDTEALSKAIGKANRKVLLLTDPGFIKK